MMIGVAIVLVALFPLFYTDPYYMTIIVTAEVVLILNISWNFVLGMAGVWNFGQLAIYALGRLRRRLADAAPDLDARHDRDPLRRAVRGGRSRCFWPSRRFACSASTRRC